MYELIDLNTTKSTFYTYYVKQRIHYAGWFQHSDMDLVLMLLVKETDVSRIFLAFHFSFFAWVILIPPKFLRTINNNQNKTTDCEHTRF